MNLGLFYDTETTGLPDWTAPSESEHQPHLVQLAAILVNLDNWQAIQHMDVIIKPEGWEIPKEVSEIHGITTEHALAVGVEEDLALHMLLSMWKGRAMRVSYNRTFDQRIIRIATKRYCCDETSEEWANKDTHECAMIAAKNHLKLLPKNRYGFRQPKLSEAYQLLTGNELQNAHTAMADTMACFDVYKKIVTQRGAENV